MTEYAAQTAMEATQEMLIKKKDGIETALAAVTLRLVDIEQGMETPSPPLTAHVTARYYEFRDDGYTGGFVSSSHYPEKSVVITADHLETMYLAAVAHQPQPISVPIQPAPESDLSATRSYGKISIDRVKLQDEDFPELHTTPEILQALFDSHQAAASEVVTRLMESVEATDPYKDIPVKLNRRELYDAVVRVEILKYCQATDPHFSVEVGPARGER